MTMITLNSTDMMASMLTDDRHAPMAIKQPRLWLKLKRLWNSY